MHTTTLNLTINNSTSNTTTINQISPYTWLVSGLTYSVSGIYTFTSLNAAGCTHTETLNLTISATPVTTVLITVSNMIQTSPSEFQYDVYCTNTGTTALAIRGYSWGLNHTTGLNGAGFITHSFVSRDASLSTLPVVTSGYTAASGHLRGTTTNAAAGNEVLLTAGVPIRLATMRVNSVTTSTGTTPLSFVALGTNYNPFLPGAPLSAIQLITAAGKTQCVTTMIVTPPGTSYAINGTANAAAAGTLQALSGLISPSPIGSSPFLLNAAACNNSTSTTAISACNSYTWTNSVTYTSSGTYSYTMAAGNASGCDSILNLNLTINTSTSSSSSATACNSYTWSANGTTYTVSGTFTSTSLNAAGCVHTSTLNLTINNSTSSSTSAMACNSYTWSANGTTYTASGTFTSTSLNAAGCVHTSTLNLTINNSTSSSTSATACDSYMWSANGATYTTSGMYSFTSLNGGGCVHTATLNLTINNSTSSSFSATACNSYTWSANGTTYTSSGTYTFTSLNAAACLHTATLILTINNSTSSTSSATACDSYTWVVNGTTYTSSGVYTFTSLNAAGCVNTVTLNLIINNSTSNSSTISAPGSYTWAINGTTYTNSGIYTVTSVNAGGCLHTETLNLTIIMIGCSFTLSVLEDQPISCNGNKDASLQAFISPSGSYTFTITSPTQPSTSNTFGYFSGLESGTHTVCATDGTCTICQTINFIEPAPLAASFTVDSVVSCLGNDGALSVNITGGTNQLQGYLTWWTNAAGDTLNDILTNNFATNLEALSGGVYHISIEDDHGCFYSTSGNLPVAAPIVVNVTFVPLACAGGTTTLIPTATGGVPYAPLIFTVNGLPLATSYVAGTYTITATDAKGCTGTTVVTIQPTSAVALGTYSYFTWCDQYTWLGVTYTTSGVYTQLHTTSQGCVVTDTLNLTINYTTVNTTTIVSCGYYTWPLNNVTYSIAGTYSVVSQNAAGCPQVDFLWLTFSGGTVSHDTMIWCDQYTWFGTTYTTSGIYTHTANNAGCIHTTYLHLTILHTTVTTSFITACVSYTWPVNGVTYTASGTYYILSQNAAGCPNVDVVCLTITGGTSSDIYYTWCDQYTWYGVTYTTSGIYSHTVNNAGCIHTTYLHLTLYQTLVSTSYITTCGSFTWLANGVTYSVSGTYYFITQNANGCPIVWVLCLIVDQGSTTNTTVSACGAYQWAVNGAIYTTSGTYTYTTTTAAGCINTNVLNLTINTATNVTQTTTACNSYTWAANGVTYTSSGIYSFTSLNAAGCMFTTTLDLTINHSSSNGNVTTSACNAYTWNGITYTASGIYTFTSLNASGCINTAVLNLTVNHSSTNGNVTATACNSYLWNGVTYTSSGIYTFTSLNSSGCVNTATLNLTINNSTSNGNATITACDSYTWNGVTYTVSGVYTFTSLNTAGCVNTATLNLTINFNTSNGNIGATACDTYSWNGTTYTASGVYTYTSINTSGCLNTATLNLIIHNSSANGNATITACNAYTWNGVTYTASGVYTFTSLNTSGCMNTAILNLTINNSTASQSTVTACNAYTWPANGNTYTASGSYTATSINVAGCLHTATLNLTVNNSSTNGNATVIACDSYTWNGTTHTASGIYTFTSLNTSGCINTATLNLTVNYSSTNGNATVTACDAYTWNGVTYTTSGIYTYTSLNTSGCLNTATLNLTVHYNSISQSSATACDTYIWSANGNTYTASGIYSFTSINASGCVNTAILNLTINYNSTNGNATITSCNSYTWNGATYSTSGTYTFTSTNASGCVNTATLNLTINNSSTNGNATITACDSYTWNGATYTTSGTYTFTSLNTAGCVNTATLNLTVNYSSSIQSIATNCNSYSWSANGITYTASGVYTATSLNASGCVHTATLILTINYSTSSQSTATACNSYTWTANGITYTTSGVYTATSMNATGCLHTATLNLTINYSSTSQSTAIACNNYTWSANGVTYTNSGVYTATSLNATGCLQTSTLNLTVNYSTTAGDVTTAQCNSYTWFGTTYTASGIYTYTTLNPYGCLNTSTLHLTIKYGSASTTTVAACNAYIWTNNVTYTVAGTYTYTTANAAGCDSALTLILTLTNGINVSPKALLSGPYMGSGLMQDSLRCRNVLPLTEPYTALSFTPIGCPGYNGGETTTAAMFAITGNNAIVDWVNVEIRTTDAAYTKVATKNALIQRDGDVVDVNGNPLYFSCVCPGNYYVSIKHRNHLGVMTATSLALTSTTQVVDFSTSAPVWAKAGVTNVSRETNGSYRLLWPGDTRTDKTTKYNGLNNDKEPIIYAVGLATPNNILVPVYRTEDANMDGAVKYNNADNDKNFILNKVVQSNAPFSTPNEILSAHVPN